MLKINGYSDMKNLDEYWQYHIRLKKDSIWHDPLCKKLNQLNKIFYKYLRMQREVQKVKGGNDPHRIQTVFVGGDSGLMMRAEITNL